MKLTFSRFFFYYALMALGLSACQAPTHSTALRGITSHAVTRSAPVGLSGN